jgi:hypothetical protein
MCTLVSWHPEFLKSLKFAGKPDAAIYRVEELKIGRFLP